MNRSYEFSIRTDSPLLLALITWLGIVGSFVLLILPVFVGALVDHRDLSASQAGWIGSADLIGFAAASIVAFRALRSVNRKSLVFVGLIMIVLGDTLSAVIAAYTPLLLARLLLSGVGAGLVISVAYLLLGETSRPERNTGIYFTFNVMGGALGLLLVPLVVRSYGAPGLFLVLAATGLVSLPLTLLFLPSGNPSSESRERVRASNALLCILVGIAFFNFGLGGVWAFVERIGLETGMGSSWVGAVLSGTYLVSMVGSATAAWQEDRIGYLIPYTMSIVGLCIAMLLLIGANSPWTFLVSLILVNLGWNYGLTYQFSAVYRFDRKSKMAVFIILVQALGLMLGPGVAGTVAARVGFDAALVLSMATCFASLALFAVARKVDESVVTE